VIELPFFLEGVAFAPSIIHEIHKMGGWEPTQPPISTYLIVNERKMSFLLYVVNARSSQRELAASEC